MQKPVVLFTLSLFTFLLSSSQNITDLETFEKAMKQGAVLTYDVTMGGKQFQFVATVKKLGDEIAYEWKTNGPENKSGSVTMNTKAISKADALFANIVGGESKLDKEFSIFISKKLFTDISSAAQASVKLGGAGDTATVLSNTISEFNFNLNDNLVSVPGWELQGGSEIKYTVDVIESVKFPLVVKTDLGWTMQLTSIKNP